MEGMQSVAPSVEEQPGRGRVGRANLVTGPITRTLVVFALPTLASNVLQSLNGSVNAIWVGRFLGENALAATANANILMFVVFSLVFGMGMASTVQVGQAFGRGDVIGARRAFGSAIGFCVLLSLLCVVPGWIFAPEILHTMGTPGPVYPLALAYLRMIFLTMPATTISVMMMMSLRGSGDSMTPLYVMILSVLMDAGLNPVFILGLGPAPQMGIAGSAFATVIANYTSLVAMVIFVYATGNRICLRGEELRYLLPNWFEMRIIITKGIPQSLQMIVMSSAMLIIIGLVNREGALTTAAFGATQQLWSYVQMPAMAVGTAVSAMAAQNIGAGRWDRVAKISRSGLITNGVMTGTLVALTLLFDRWSLGLFLGPGSPAIEIGRHMQFLASGSYLLFGMTLVLNGVMRANNVVVAPMIIMIVTLVPARLGFYFLTYDYFGADALWWGFTVSAFVALGLSGLYYRYSGWEKVRMPMPLG